ncbi:DoxX family protein [Massilia sp. S19_KUP03_FR1]|uniref:DoxX family protein n=1 Tax=Massilia sp. S19_KUP03_FR1 TaxID=3025503 RepID=UPI002FCDA6AD
MKRSLPHVFRARQVSTAQCAGLAFVFLWFFIGGIAHFTATATEALIVPPYIPWPVAAVLVSGVFELLGAVGIVLPATRKAAGIGLFLLTLAVTPAHVYMLQQPELFPVPIWALWLRLPIQVALLWLIIWSTWRLHPRAG